MGMIASKITFLLQKC